MNPYNFSVLCFGFCSLLVGLFVGLKRQDQVGKLFFILSLSYAAWALPFSIKISDNVSYGVALHAARIANCGAAFIPVIWFHFCLVYIGREKTHQILLRAFYSVPFLVLTTSYTPWFITGLRPILSFKYYAIPGAFYHLMTATYFLIVPFGFWQLISRIKEVSEIEKKQILGLFWAAFAGYLGGAATFLPIYGVAFPQEGVFLLPIYPFALAYVMTKQKLFDMEELAQAARRDKLTAIGVLAASINHEVKNPLFIIKGLAESCLERQKEGVFQNDRKALESSNDAMKRSIDQADRAMDIIKRLSLFAKAEIESEIKFEPVKVSAVIDDILPLIRYELAAHSIALTREIPPDLPEVHVDRRYLEEILFNLLVNAIQALKGMGKPGEIIIRAMAERGKVCLTIQDNGPGIPDDKIKDVFRPFYTTKEEGAGLGLYITQQLVEKIRGKIDVRSEVGFGTTFAIVLLTSASEDFQDSSEFHFTSGRK
jgi:signal transduction histidine kinase